MKKNLPVLILSITLLFLGSCKSASKLYEKGDYAEAVELATKKLRKNPNDTELRSVLRNAYDYAVNDHERKIREYNNSTNELKWEWIYYEYSGLQRLSQAIWSSSEATELVNPPDYTSFLETYADNASSVRYDKGIRWMEQQDRESMKQAYREFKAALGFKPGDMDIQLKMREAYDMAVINVIVMPFNESSYRYSSYTNTYDQFYKNNLVSNLRSYGPDMFVKFYTEWEARNNNIRPDQFIDISFRELNIGRTHDERKIRQVSKDVVVKEIVYSKDSVVKEYKKVFAKITTTTRIIRSFGNMVADIRNADGRILWSTNLDGQHTWQTQFSTFTGDDRALSENDKALINKKREQAPYQEEIVKQIMNQMNNDLYSRIRSFYRTF